MCKKTEGPYDKTSLYQDVPRKLYCYLLLMHSQQYRQQVKLCSVIVLNPIYAPHHSSLLEKCCWSFCYTTERGLPRYKMVKSFCNIQAYYIAMLFDGFNDVVSIRGWHMSEEDTCCISVSPSMKLYTEMKKWVNLNKHESGSICIECCRGMCSYYALTEPYK